MPTSRLPIPVRAALPPLLALPFLLAGCGGGGGNGGSPSRTTSSSPSSAAGSTTDAAPQSVSAATPSGLTATLTEDRGSVGTGGAVTYTFTLTNNTAQPITYREDSFFPLGIVFGVFSPTGQLVFPDVTGPGNGVGGVSGAPVTLAPGQSSGSVAAPVSAFASAGAYTATATVELSSGSSGFVDTTVGPLTVTVH